MGLFFCRTLRFLINFDNSCIGFIKQTRLTQSSEWLKIFLPHDRQKTEETPLLKKDSTIEAETSPQKILQE